LQTIHINSDKIVLIGKKNSNLPLLKIFKYQLNSIIFAKDKNSSVNVKRFITVNNHSNIESALKNLHLYIPSSKKNPPKKLTKKKAVIEKNMVNERNFAMSFPEINNLDNIKPSIDYTYIKMFYNYNSRKLTQEVILTNNLNNVPENKRQLVSENKTRHLFKVPKDCQLVLWASHFYRENKKFKISESYPIRTESSSDKRIRFYYENKKFMITDTENKFKNKENTNITSNVKPPYVRYELM
jgi:hypothetical protein